MPKKKVEDKEIQTSDVLFKEDFDQHDEYLVKCKVWNPVDLINTKCSDKDSIFHRFENQFFSDSTTPVNKRVFKLKKEYIKYNDTQNDITGCTPRLKFFLYYITAHNENTKYIKKPVAYDYIEKIKGKLLIQKFGKLIEDFMNNLKKKQFEKVKKQVVRKQRKTSKSESKSESNLENKTKTVTK